MALLPASSSLAALQPVHLSQLQAQIPRPKVKEGGGIGGKKGRKTWHAHVRLVGSWLLAVPMAAKCRPSRPLRCRLIRNAQVADTDSETPRRAALAVLGSALAVTGVDAAFRASDEKYAALGTILAPAPYKETLRTELVPGHIWGFEQCIALASVSTNIRMTAVKLRNGDLWVSAPISPTRQCLRLLDELGKVAHLVVPSTALEHKASLAEFKRTYPKATIWATPGQAPPITVPSDSRILGQGQAPPWADELDCKVFFVEPPVTDTFAEAVFFHKETRTLLVTDCALKLPANPPKILESYGYDGTPGPISLEQWRPDTVSCKEAETMESATSLFKVQGHCLRFRNWPKSG